MKKCWYKTKEIAYYKQFFNCGTEAGTERLLDMFYLEIDTDGVTSICNKTALRVVKLLSFKGDKIIYKDLDAILKLSPLKRDIFSEVIKKHFTAIINI